MRMRKPEKIEQKVISARNKNSVQICEIKIVYDYNIFSKDQNMTAH